jgi:hypothetical protein
MKKFVSAVLTVIILASCGQKDVVVPEQERDAQQQVGKVFYKDAYVAIADIKGEPVGNDVKLQFNSLYEKDVVRIDVMSAPYENMVCYIYEQNIPVSSSKTKTYTVLEKNANSPVRYYYIKYTLKSGGWIITPAYKYEN